MAAMAEKRGTIGAVAAGVTAALLVASFVCSCGSSGQVVTAHMNAAPLASAPASQVPMEMITFGDRGFRRAHLTVHVQRQVMFMFYNGGARSHAFQSQLPVTDVELATASGASVMSATSSLHVVVKPGQETDVTFVPSRQGTFGIVVDGRLAGTLIATA